MKFKRQIVVIFLAISILLNIQLIGFILKTNHNIDRNLMYSNLVLSSFINNSMDNIENGVELYRKNIFSYKEFKKTLEKESTNLFWYDTLLEKTRLLNPKFDVNLFETKAYLNMIHKKQVITNDDLENIEKLAHIHIYASFDDFYISKKITGSEINPYYIQGYLDMEKLSEQYLKNEEK
ncbi:hypothetical protein [Helicovermis profundi]|uniref:Uncharacterized protein n=1 Tax=Helicovermis profundi TaxID=3065157 RepID=A0AAU9E8S4_9FIRM|nr:hypothetical protein HLPR_04980 [Clostridia bacterium S502]